MAVQKQTTVVSGYITNSVPTESHPFPCILHEQDYWQQWCVCDLLPCPACTVSKWNTTCSHTCLSPLSQSKVKLKVLHCQQEIRSNLHSPPPPPPPPFFFSSSFFGPVSPSHPSPLNAPTIHPMFSNPLHRHPITQFLCCYLEWFTCHFFYKYIHIFDTRNH